MSIAVVKYLNRFGTRAVRLPFCTVLRTSTNEPCPPKAPEPCPKDPNCKQSESGSKQPEPSSKQSEPSPKPPEPCPPPLKLTCPEPPPCPTMPQCPPSICPPVMDPNNPCNYCPPPCIDPTYPDITKLKKLQCLFQQEDDLPIFLKKGNSDAFLYQLTLVTILLSLIMAFINLHRMGAK